MINRFLFFISLLLLSLNVYSIDVKTHIPVNAPTLIPIVVKEHRRYIDDIKVPGYFASLIEQESCISLTHSRCWKPNSTLSTKRELGIGLGQITKAYDSEGKVRFDSLTNLKNKYKTELGELNWTTIANRPDLQIRAIVFMSRDNWNALKMVKDPSERLAMTTAAYNGGLGGISKERRLCGLKKGCDPQKWFGNVEKTCGKSTKPLYGKRSACDINRDHVQKVMTVRLDKYNRYIQSKKL